MNKEHQGGNQGGAATKDKKREEEMNMQGDRDKQNRDEGEENTQ